MRVSLNFSFHKVSLDGKTYSGTTALFCENTPYTVGNYEKKADGTFKGKAFIFKPGHGTPDHETLCMHAHSEDEIRERLIAAACPLVLRYYFAQVSKKS